MVRIGIIGGGAFGSFLAHLCKASGVSVRIYSRSRSVDGITYFTLEETAECEYLILAVPIHAFRETLLRVLPLVAAHTVLVDVSTVKAYTEGVLKEAVGDHLYIATHPMFGPESFAKRGGTLKGCTLVVTGSNLPTEELSGLIAHAEQIGLRVEQMTGDAHDRLLAHTLFFTHLTAQIAVRTGVARTVIDTLSFSSLMDAVESVAHDTALFHDVYRFNPYCKEVLERFHQSAEQVVKNLEHHRD
jgi:prephenate dehydrogenase